MTELLFDSPAASLAIAGERRRFPVRRIFCVGRNYAAHAKEMGGDGREPPFFFMKPVTALLPLEEDKIAALPIPPVTENYHHEVELVVALNKGGIALTPDEAIDLVFGYAIGLDMTRRDLQKQMSEQKKPWELGKAADFSAPVGPVHPASKIGPLASGAIRLSVNGELRQHGDLADMIWKIPEQIAHLSRYFTLQPGDLLFTGTPEGVGPVIKGQTIEAQIEKLGSVHLKAA